MCCCMTACPAVCVEWCRAMSCRRTALVERCLGVAWRGVAWFGLLFEGTAPLTHQLGALAGLLVIGTISFVVRSARCHSAGLAPPPPSPFLLPLRRPDVVGWMDMCWVLLRAASHQVVQRSVAKKIGT